MCVTGAATTNRGRGREAERGIDDLALVLDGNVVGGLQRRRLPSGEILSGGRDDAGLDNGRGITADNGLRPV